MTTDFQYDDFSSHNSADKPRVRRLAERLRAAQFSFVPRTSHLALRNAGRRFIPLLLANAHHGKEPVAICDLEPA